MGPVRKPHCWFSHEAAQMGRENTGMLNMLMSQWKKNKMSQACADPEGGTGGPDPPWNLKILP